MDGGLTPQSLAVIVMVLLMLAAAMIQGGRR